MADVVVDKARKVVVGQSLPLVVYLLRSDRHTCNDFLRSYFLD